MMPAQASKSYSVNPHTVKSRNRKMKLSGARKVEEAGKVADYKALKYAQKLLESEQEYLAASDAVKKSMLKETMFDTMEKRRIKGQDTVSKLAAFNARDARAVRAADAGPTPRATIPQFLEENGYVPPRAAPQNHLSDSIAFTTNNNEVASDGSSSNFAITSMSPNARDVKRPVIHNPSANMTPEPMESIEAEQSNETASMRNEAGRVHNMCGSAFDMNSDLSNYRMQIRRANNVPDKAQVNILEGRLSHLEKVVRAMQNVLVPAMQDRLTTMEAALEELKSKVGEGCNAEVAKMREVFGGMRETMARVGNFL